MPCGCRVPLEIYPETAEWGPLFWKLLHGLSIHAGIQKNINLQDDERRTWIHIVTKLQFCIPCTICSGHYSEYLGTHSVTELKTIQYAEFGSWIRNWFWKLHNIINEGNDKPIFPESDLEPTYKYINTKETWRALEPVMKKAIQLSGISLLSWKTWLNYVKILQGIYGIL